MPDIKIKSHDGNEFDAYIAISSEASAARPAPVIIMIQEIFGINQEMRQKCDEYAKEGFIAIAPDLFWRMERNVQLTDKTQEEWDKAFDLMNRFDLDLGMKDLESTLLAARDHKLSNGRVGCIGYCLGGKLAYLMAARTNVDATVSYYGVGLDELLDEGDNIDHPTILHIAEEDKFVSKDAQKKIKDALHDNEFITAYSYPSVNHAFARGEGEHYDEHAANLANRRTRDFLNVLKFAKAA